MPPDRAIEAAITLARNPSLRDVMRSRSLPAGTVDVLSILAREEAVPVDLAHRARMDEGGLRAALEYYVQEVMLFPGAAPRRVLGVGPDAPRAEMRKHLRLLMAWLHPDLADDPWRAPFAARVLAGWRAASAGQGEPAAPDQAVASEPEARERDVLRELRRGPLPQSRPNSRPNSPAKSRANSWAMPGKRLAAHARHPRRRVAPQARGRRMQVWLLAALLAMLLALSPALHEPSRTWLAGLLASQHWSMTASPDRGADEFLGQRPFDARDLRR